MTDSAQQGVWLYGGFANKFSTIYRCSAAYRAYEYIRAVEYIFIFISLISTSPGLRNTESPHRQALDVSSHFMKRRTFIKRSFWGIASLGFLGGLYSWQIEPFWVEFVKQKMPIKNLPEHLIGKTVMQISDIHIGRRFDYRYIIKSFDKAKEFNPDFVAYTGDFVTTHKDEVQYKDLKEVLKNCVQGKMGTVGILGNHDYGRSWAQQDVAENISKIISENGIRLLKNEQLELEGLNFIGFDDYWGLNFKPEKVMNEFDKLKANVVLCHNPDVCDLDVWNGYQGWILSGHTHGGQVKPPFLDAPIVPVKNKKYTSGRFDLTNNRTLYINRCKSPLFPTGLNY